MHAFECEIEALGLSGRGSVWVAGRVPSAPRLAVVGSRAARRPLTAAIEPMLREARARGWSLVSGGARGVDGCAHRLALELGLRQIAVLPLGPDRPYPAEHRGLYEAIVAQGGAVVSTRGPGTVPTRGMFASRNRWVVALADAVWVVQAGVRSGSVGTGRLALREGRRLAVLGRSPGCAELLARGACELPWPSREPDDEDLSVFRDAAGRWLEGRPVAQVDRWPPELQPLRRQLLGAGPSGMSADDLEDPLLSLQWLAQAERAGLVLQVAPGRYVCAGGTAAR